MQLFSIDCRSACGSYFQAYAKRLLVVADDREDAIARALEWFASRGESPASTPATWEVDELVTRSVGVIDYVIDSDY